MAPGGAARRPRWAGVQAGEAAGPVLGRGRAGRPVGLPLSRSARPAHVLGGKLRLPQPPSRPPWQTQAPPTAACPPLPALPLPGGVPAPSAARSPDSRDLCCGPGRPSQPLPLLPAREVSRRSAGRVPMATGCPHPGPARLELVGEAGRGSPAPPLPAACAPPWRGPRGSEAGPLPAGSPGAGPCGSEGAWHQAGPQRLAARPPLSAEGPWLCPSTGPACRDGTVQAARGSRTQERAQGPFRKIPPSRHVEGGGLWGPRRPPARGGARGGPPAQRERGRTCGQGRRSPGAHLTWPRRFTADPHPPSSH